MLGLAEELESESEESEPSTPSTAAISVVVTESAVSVGTSDPRSDTLETSPSGVAGIEGASNEILK